jgi:hypothetical protein
MSVEAEKYLERASHVRNVTNPRGKLVDPATRYLRHNEREKRKTEANRLKQMLTRQNVYDANIGEESRKQAMIHLTRLEEDLEDHSPPTDLSGETKDALYKELQREEEIYRQGMVSHEEMRRNPVGAVDRHLKHSKANRDRALKIKNLRMLLNPDSDEQDLCNLENLRPSIVRPDGTSTFMPGAQISGHFAMTPQAKANWPENMTEVPEGSCLAQAERQELEELRELKRQLDEKKKENQRKYGTSEEARARQAKRAEAASKRMKEYWAKRTKGGDPKLSGPPLAEMGEGLNDLAKDGG